MLKRVMILCCFVLMVSGAYALDLNLWTGFAADPNEATNWFNPDNWSLGTPNFAPHYYDFIQLDGAVVDIDPILSDPNDPQSPVLVAQSQRVRVSTGSDICTLNVNAGAVLESATEFVIHYNSTSVGLGTVNLYGTVATGGITYIPRKGHAHLTMYPGSVYETRYPVDGSPGGGTVRSYGEGGTVAQNSSCLFDMLGGVFYGTEIHWPRGNGNATLNLVDGEINCIDTVANAGSKDFRIAHDSPYDRGLVNQTGGILKCDQLVICGDADAGTGTDTGDGKFGYAIYDLKGGELNCRQIYSNSTAFDPSRHQVNLIGGKLNFAEWDASMGTMYNMGTIVSPGHYSNNAPMDETMELIIEGDYVDAPNLADPNFGVPTLSFDLGSASDYDRITFQGDVTLDSELVVNLVDGFELSLLPTDVFTIVSSDNAITGGFTNLDGNRISAYGDGSFEATFLVTIDNLSTPKTIVLSDRQLGPCGGVVLAGDFNIDCKVDFLDLVELSDVWLDSYDLIDFSSLSQTWQSYVDLGDNLAPNVTACDNQIVLETVDADLDGSISDDGKPYIPGQVQSVWSKVSGPGTVTFNDASAIDTTAGFSELGRYMLRLTGDDGDLTGSDDTMVTVVRNPVSYWRFDETGGTTAADSIGTNDGVLQNGPTWQPLLGQVEGALHFDGVNDYVDCGNDASVLLGAGPISVFAWIKLDAGYDFTNRRYVLNLVNRYGMRITTDAKLDGYVWGCNKIGTTVFETGTWYHVGFTFDGTKTALYVNGRCEGFTEGSPSVSGSSPLFIGKRESEPDSEFSGLIDEVYLFNEVLGVDEIQGLAMQYPPEIQSCLPVGPVQVAANTTQSFSVSAVGDPLHYEWTLNGTTVLGGDSAGLEYTPGTWAVGPHQLVAEVTDGRGGRASCTWQVTVELAFPASGAQYYVATNGSDSNPGTLAQPFATLEKARDTIRTLKSGSGLPAGGVTVWLRGGTYQRSASFQLLSTDSGTSGKPIVYRAYNDEDVRIMGGLVLDPADFDPLSPAAAARVNASVNPADMVEFDLNGSGLQNTGPYPDQFQGTGGLLELYFDNERQQIARYPNAADMTMNGVIWNGTLTYDCDIVGDGVGKFYYSDPRHENWLTAVDHGLWLKGLWRVPWTQSAIKVSSIDTINDIVTQSASISLGIGDKYRRDACHPEGSYAEPYYAMNLLEEIDQPGEWCLDFLDNKIYFLPPDVITAGSVMLADMDAPLVNMNGVSDVILRGLTFEVGTGNGIEMTDGSRNLVVDCTLRNLSQMGIHITGGWAHGVLSCDIYDLGEAGIECDGGDPFTLTPANHFIVNNHIHDIGKATLAFAIKVGRADYRFETGSVGYRVAHNHIHDTPYGGVWYRGNEGILEYNKVHDISQVGADTGGFYTDTSFASWGNVLRYNFVYNTNAQNGCYMDNADSGDLLYGNILYNTGTGVASGGGKDNIVRNNIFISTSSDGIACSHRDGIADPTTWGGEIRLNELYLYDYQNSPWSVAYPGITDILDFYPDLPTGNVFDDNVFVWCGGQIIYLKGTAEEMQYVEVGDSLDLDTDPGFSDAGALDFQLDPGSIVYDNLPDFKPIPFDMIGLYQDAFRQQLQ